MAMVDAQLIAVLEAQANPGETIHAAFHRKESNIRDLFAQLTLAEALTLHDRLTNPKTDDLLGSQFTRLLMADRRGRLLTFLADARRRDAIESARRKK